MNLHALRVFTEVANNNSVTKAAQHMMLSQPAVSAQIRNLETELEVKLITSRGRNIKLTEYGISLYAQSKRFFAFETDIENELLLLKNGVKGKLRISATNLPSMAFLPKWIVGFSEQLDSIHVELRKGNSRQTLDRLLNYEADMALVTGGWEEPGIKRRLLFEDELCFTVASRHPLAIAENETTLNQLVQHPFVFREEGSSTQNRLLSLCVGQSVEMPKSMIRVDGLYESIQFVKAGYGVMLVPRLAIEDELARGNLAIVSVQNIYLRLPIWLCLRDHEDVRPLTESFILFMDAQIDRHSKGY